MSLPDLLKVRRRFPRERLEDVREELQSQLRACPVELPSGATVAIAVGSRGITNLRPIVAALVSYLKSLGCTPFIVPAMGSHGGATAEGQEAVLASFGITEPLVGAPVRSSMEAVELPNDGIGNRVFMDRNARGADATILVNRVKVHTDFHGPFESGLLKMASIGLGKKLQASEIHSFGIAGLKERIVPTARKVLEHGNVVMGIGIVENAYHETMIVRAIPARAIESEEKRLLEVARRNMPALPIDSLDVLVIDEMGKDVSGAGVDPNIIGRIRIRGQEEPEKPTISSIVVADLTEASHGNAVGIGLVDVITRRMYEKIDFAATYENVVTSSFLERGRLPVVAKDGRDAVEIALRSCGLGPDGGERASGVRLLRIKNTLRLEEAYVSPSVLQEIKDAPGIEVVGPPRALISERGELSGWE